jgi:hypothetical protein
LLCFVVVVVVVDDIYIYVYFQMCTSSLKPKDMLSDYLRCLELYTQMLKLSGTDNAGVHGLIVSVCVFGCSSLCISIYVLFFSFTTYQPSILSPIFNPSIHPYIYIILLLLYICIYLYHLFYSHQFVHICVLLLSTGWRSIRRRRFCIVTCR